MDKITTLIKVGSNVQVFLLVLFAKQHKVIMNKKGKLVEIIGGELTEMVSIFELLYDLKEHLLNV